MISSIVIKQKIFRIAEIIHLRIFGYEMSDEMRRFLGNLSWSFFGGFFSALVLLLINILAGRWLGPEEYGKYGLIVAIAAILMIPMILGLDTASIHFITKTNKKEEWDRIISSVLFLTLPLIAVISLVCFFWKKTISSWLQVSEDIILFAILFAAILAFRMLSEAFLRAFHKFKYQSGVRIFEVLFVSLIFFLLVFFGGSNFRSYIFSILSGYLVFILLSFYVFFRRIGIGNVKVIKKLFQYGVIAVLGSVFGILTGSIDKIFINKFIGSDQLGIYTAYSTVSFLLMGQVASLFVNVLFPHLSSLKSQEGILRKINKFSLIFFFPIWFLLVIAVSVSIFIFGSRYPLSIVYVLEFSLLGVIYFYFLILWWVIASAGEKGIRFTSFTAVAVGLLFIGLMYIFKYALTINLVVIFFVVSIALAIIWGNMNYEKYK